MLDDGLTAMIVHEKSHNCVLYVYNILRIPPVS